MYEKFHENKCMNININQSVSQSIKEWINQNQSKNKIIKQAINGDKLSQEIDTKKLPIIDLY